MMNGLKNNKNVYKYVLALFILIIYYRNVFFYLIELKFWNWIIYFLLR